MNTARLQGFAAGVLATVLALATVGTVLATGRTITIEDRKSVV